MIFENRKSVEIVGKRLSPLLVPFSYNHFVIVRHRGGPFPLSGPTATPLSSFSHARISKKEISRFGRRLRRLSAALVYVRLPRCYAHKYTHAFTFMNARVHIFVRLCSYSQHPGFLFGTAHRRRKRTRKKRTKIWIKGRPSETP